MYFALGVTDTVRLLNIQYQLTIGTSICGALQNVTLVSRYHLHTSKMGTGQFPPLDSTTPV